MSATTRTHYDVLGVTPQATEDEVRSAYRKAARRLHPDMNGGQHLPEYLEVQEANRVLSDPGLRSSYDYELANPGASAEPEPEFYEEEEEEEWGAEETTAADEGGSSEIPETPTGKPRLRQPRNKRWPLLVIALALLSTAAVMAYRTADQWAEARTALIWLGVLSLFTYWARNRGCLLMIFVAITFMVFGWVWQNAGVVLVPPLLAMLALWSLLGYVKGRPRVRLMSRRKARGSFAFGDPGGSRRRMAHATGDDPHVESEPQRRTAEMLNELADIPALRVFHDVLIPGTNTIVDHVLLMDGFVTVVTPLRVSARRAWWGGKGNLVFDGQTWPNPITVRHLQALTGACGGNTYVSVVSVDSPMPGGIDVDNSGAPEGSFLVSHAHLVDELRGLLLGAPGVKQVVDRAAMRALHDLVVTD